MRYGRIQRGEQKKERPFLRRLKYESAKEGLGKLTEWGAAGVGMLVGLAAARLGLPISPSIAVTGGAIAGGMIGAQGKAVVVATLDHLRERRDMRSATAGGRSSVAAEGTGPESRGGGHRVTPGRDRSARHRSSAKAAQKYAGSMSIAGQVISGIEQVMEQIEQTAAKLNAVAASMRNSQDSMMVLIYGGRADVVRRTHDAMSGARDNVYDSAVLLRSANDDLRAYRATI
ncbi:hypothetical protein AB0J90_19435 [Micromonospora sp. NPDC049523]|uniref:hypothetical protein n=1 Tax=Micromonospora sp. NPDC049523 TaxID=3155921 RepID=UPI0034433F29